MGKSGEGPNLTRSLSSSSSISSDFEFTISLSPASRKTSSTLYCPADELFFKGQLLPLHLPPRLRIIQTLTTPTSTGRPNSPPPPPDRHASPPISFSTTTAAAAASRPRPATTVFPPRVPPSIHLTSTANNDSSGWSSDATSSRDSNSSSCDSSRRTSSATTDDEDAHLTSLKKLRHFARLPTKKPVAPPTPRPPPPPPPLSNKPPSKMKISSIFLTKGKKMSRSAKNVFQKYINKVKPLYEKISHMKAGEERLVKARDSCSSTGSSSFHATHHSHSFSGNLSGFPKRRASARPIRGYIGSCPPSVMSSPSHSGVLTFSGEFLPSMDSSSMEELQSAIQGAIAYCKNSNAVHDK
ncbi:probable membrane-associated kinase regulator 1 [Nymphaea colorata]|uniref:Membrane-associated kinase regulator 1 n=1 Tax=Nymphaea colorata TaxID=210225 RepID=A0A5K0Z5Q5_9MAGN|nr:probable membrane-associated kinase regulator 1 [Nymphaea colorata]